jgi:hypothetical protein
MAASKLTKQRSSQWTGWSDLHHVLGQKWFFFCIQLYSYKHINLSEQAQAAAVQFFFVFYKTRLLFQPIFWDNKVSQLDPWRVWENN